MGSTWMFAGAVALAALAVLLAAALLVAWARGRGRAGAARSSGPPRSLPEHRRRARS